MYLCVCVVCSLCVSVPCLCMSCKVTRGVVMYETGRCTRVKVGTEIFIQPPVLFTSPIATNVVSGASRAHFLPTDVGNIGPSPAIHSNLYIEFVSITAYDPARTPILLKSQNTFGHPVVYSRTCKREESVLQAD